MKPALIVGGLLAVILLLMLNGCFLELGVEGGSLASEGAALGVDAEGLSLCAGEEALLSATDRELLTLEERKIIGGYVSNEAALTEFENVRMVDVGEGKPPQLQLIKYDMKTFAEVIDKRTIQFLDGREITLHNDIYALRGDDVPAYPQLRTYHSWQHYNAILNDNMRVVIKLEEESGYYKVLIGRSGIRWISPEYLVPVIIVANHTGKKTITINYPNGTVQERYDIENGEKNGMYTAYHKNGTLWTKRAYSNGKLVAVLSNFDNKGNPEDKGDFNNGNGSVKYYDEQGLLLYSQTYINGKLVIIEDPPARNKVTYNSHTTTGDNHNKTSYNYRNNNSSKPRSNSAYQRVNGFYRTPMIFSGDVEFCGTVINALVTIPPNSHFIIERGALVKSDIILGQNSSLRIDGNVEGNIYNHGGQVLKGNGLLKGNIYYR